LCLVPSVDPFPGIAPCGYTWVLWMVDGESAIVQGGQPQKEDC